MYGVLLLNFLEWSGIVFWVVIVISAMFWGIIIIGAKSEKEIEKIDYDSNRNKIYQ